MAIDLNADVGKIIKDFLSGKKADPASKRGSKKELNHFYKQALLKATLITCVTISFCYTVHMLSSEPVVREQSEFTSVPQLQEAMQTLENNLLSSRKMLASNKENVGQIINYYSDSEGSKNLFRVISSIASDKSLAVKSITKGNSEEFSKPAPYQKSKVIVEIDGIYGNYAEFKQELMRLKPILTINSEKIKVTTSSYGERGLSFTLEITDYSVDKKSYEELLEKEL